MIKTFLDKHEPKITGVLSCSDRMLFRGYLPMLCIGIGLLAGLSGRPAARSLLLFTAAAWLVGGVVGLQGAAGDWSLAVPLMLLGVGVLVALDAPLPAALTVVLATVITGIDGLLNGMALASLGFIGVLGLYSAFVVVLLLTAALVVGLKAVWARAAVRVAGSWIGAVGLLLLGWSIRPMLA